MEPFLCREMSDLWYSDLLSSKTLTFILSGFFESQTIDEYFSNFTGRWRAVLIYDNLMYRRQSAGKKGRILQAVE